MQTTTGIKAVNETSGLDNYDTVNQQYIFLIGEKASISSTLLDDYKFVNWTNASDQSEAYTNIKNEIIMTKPLSLIASTKLDVKSNITLDVTLDGKSYSDYKGTITFVNDVSKDIITDFTKVPDENYKVYIDGKATTISVTADGYDKVVTIPYFSLTINVYEGILKTTGSGNYISGTKVDIKAFIDLTAGYIFKSWTGSIISTAHETDIIMNEAKVVNAYAIKSEGPKNPSNPDDSNNAGTPSTPDSPDTGDTTSKLLMIALLNISAIISINSLKKKFVK